MTHILLKNRDTYGLVGFSSRQKITAALRMLSLGVSADVIDDYCRTSESTAMESLKRFCSAIRHGFGEHHLRLSTRADFEQQLAVNTARDFSNMFGSLDCIHYKWKIIRLHGRETLGIGRESGQLFKRLLLIKICTFGLPGSNNDLNVLDRSSLIHNMLTGEASDFTFEVNGKEYNRYYLLADGIYPQWSCFVQSIHKPGDEKRKNFAKRQEACRKDVERCF